MRDYGNGICKICGKEFIKKGARQTRCSECAARIDRLKAREYSQQRAAERKKERERRQAAKDPNECKKNDCIYKASAGAIKICDYFWVTGNLRGCPVQGCVKYIKAVGRR